MHRNNRLFRGQVLAGFVALVLAPGNLLSSPAHATTEVSARVVAATSIASAARTAGSQRYVHVASFNVSGVLNDSKGAPHRPWRVRGTRVARQLLGQEPSNQPAARADVIALQEANNSKRLANGRTQFTDLVHRLNTSSRGNPYRAAGVHLDSNGTRIAYNSSALHLIRAGAYKWSAQETRVDGFRMMAWARFRVRASNWRFFFASVHLETASRSVRLRQWKQLIAKVPKLANGLPVLIGGDFNATRNYKGDAARTMLPRMREAGFRDALGQDGPGYLTLGQARPQHLVNARFNSVNHFRRRLGHYRHADWVGQDIDYLFASNGLNITSWGLVADHAEGSDRLRGVIPSDHNMIRAVVAP
jgi:endonuclease/exonuclease/phosphatase family metal-dependent hydrolase